MTISRDLTLSLELKLELKLEILANIYFWRRLFLEYSSLLSCYSNPRGPEQTLNSQSRTGGTIRKLIVISIAFVWRYVMQNRNHEVC